MTAREIRDLLGVSRAEFSRRYKIPVRTLENWDSDTNKAPEWALSLLERVVKEDAMEQVMQNVQGYIAGLRQRHGHDIVTDPVVEGSSIYFTLQPDDQIQGTMFEVTLDGAVRNKGIAPGCFWTEWRENVFNGDTDPEHLEFQ